jgi:hypothetical protein
MARKPVNVINLSFLDAMTCGFGAVILFFMIINATMDRRREDITIQEAGEADQVELKVVAGRRNLTALKEDLSVRLNEQAVTKGVIDLTLEEIRKFKEELDELLADTSAKKESIEALKSDLETLEEESRKLAETPSGTDNIRTFVGEGDRQYLTGLRMGGSRVVILVDTSTSMLDKTLVNIIRRRNMSVAQQRSAPKWKQTVATVDWLTAQLEEGTDFQIYGFNETAWSLVAGTDDRWLSVGAGGDQLQEAVDELEQMTPTGGTSLAAAFEAVNKLRPKPDNIFLLVDGLPTLGLVASNRRGVTGRERLRHFQRAVRMLPRSVPVNIILFAMEGDPNAAHLYWELALTSGGSLLAPSEDWP